MLLLLERHELTVGELCAVLQLPQSTVSRHLKTLADASWVASRRDGTSRCYTLSLDERGRPTRRLWKLLREQVSGDQRRRPGRAAAEGVLARRQTAVAGVLRVRGRAVGQAARGAVRARVALAALPGLLDERVGRSATSGAAPGRSRRRSRRSWRTSSPSTLGRDAAGRAPRGCGTRTTSRCGAASSRRCRSTTATLDAATLLLVLHHVPDPAAVLGEAARVLRPGGRLLIVDMLPHDREEYRQQMGHVWLGFGEDQLRRLLAAAGFDQVRIVPLPPIPGAKGPALFVATRDYRQSWQQSES